MVCTNCQKLKKETKGIPSNKLLSGIKHNVKKCKLCPGLTIQSPDANYCQSCAYKNGICSSCGVKTLDISMHRQKDF